MYEIVVMNEEYIGVAGKEVVEHIWTAHNGLDAERFLCKLRLKGFQPRIRRFEAETVNFRNMDEHIQRLCVLNADKANILAAGD